MVLVVLTQTTSSIFFGPGAFQKNLRRQFAQKHLQAQDMRRRMAWNPQKFQLFLASLKLMAKP